MGKMIENPKYNIISVRVDDLELYKIMDKAEEYGVTLSELVRGLLNREINK